MPIPDYETLMRSLREKFLPLPDNIRILAGHGNETTVGAERRANPYLLDLQ